MTDNTFDASKNYKKICYRADRDLLNTELNESQEIELHERRLLLDKILAQGTILSGFVGTVDGNHVTLTDGVVYLDGSAVTVPGAVFSFPETGSYLIYVDVFRRVVTASEDPSLVNPLTGEPTAEREKWISSLQTRDTSDDPLPEGAFSRTIVPIYHFNRDTRELRPYVGTSVSSEDIFSAFANHAGHSGLDRHPAATENTAGFMTPEQVGELASIEAILLLKADVSALNAHKTSSDHDGRYYTESESDSRFTPMDHVGSGGNVHSLVTDSQAGFMSAEQLATLETLKTSFPTKADDSDLDLLAGAFSAHKSSGDHDGRYYTESESNGRFASIFHVGSGGDSHATATALQNGFMGAEDKIQLGGHETRIVTLENEMPRKAEATEITAINSALNSHKTSGDHDARYAPIAHIGDAGNAHGLATPARHGFISKELCGFLQGLIKWDGYYDYGNDHTKVLPHGIIAPGYGMIWHGKCDNGSTHQLAANLRATSSAVTALFEIYHISGTVTLQTGGRTSLANPADHPSTVPGSKVYCVDLYPDSFTCVVINIEGSGDVGFSLNITPGDNRQICLEFDPNSAGLPSST